MNMESRPTSLSAAQRQALRRIITTQAAWRDYAKEHDLRIDGMSVTQLLSAAEALSIMPQEYMPQEYMNAIGPIPESVTTIPPVVASPSQADLNVRAGLANGPT